MTRFVAMLTLLSVLSVAACDQEDDASSRSTARTPSRSGARLSTSSAVANKTASADMAAAPPTAMNDPCNSREETGGIPRYALGPSSELPGAMTIFQLCHGGIAAGSSAKLLLKSVDGGRTWTLIAQTSSLVGPPSLPGVGRLPSGFGATAMWFQTTQRGWMGLSSPGKNLWRTTDGGFTWIAVQALPPPMIVTSILFTSDLEGTVETPESAWTTIDGGETWTEQPYR